MNPHFYLRCASVFATYALRLTALFACCWFLARLTRSAARRFAVWSVLITVAFGYWTFLLGSLTVAAAGAQTLAVSVAITPRSSFVAHHIGLTVPATWSSSVILAGKLLAFAYVVGVLVLLVRLATKQIALRRALQYAVDPSAELSSLFRRLRMESGVRRCELMILPGLSSPGTSGLMRPLVLLPEVYADYVNDDQVTDVLRHELAHVVRRDYIWAMLTDVAHCLLFFHPALSYSINQLRLEREVACDLAVIQARPERRADYAEVLTRFARLGLTRKANSSGVDFASAPSLLGVRVRTLLSEPSARKPWLGVVRGVCSVLVLSIIPASLPVTIVAISFAAEYQLDRFLAPEVQNAPLAPSLANNVDVAVAKLAHPRRLRSSLPSQKHPQLAATARISNAPIPTSAELNGLRQPIDAIVQPVATGPAPGSAPDKPMVVVTSDRHGTSIGSVWRAPVPRPGEPIGTSRVEVLSKIAGIAIRIGRERRGPERLIGKLL